LVWRELNQCTGLVNRTWFELEGCELLQGERYRGEWDWEIRVKPQGSEFSLHLMNQIQRLKQGMLVDQIKFESTSDV